MCRCTPELRTPFCGKPGCASPQYAPNPPDKPAGAKIVTFVSEVDFNQLQAAVGELHKVGALHAEGMKHMTDALVAFDARLRAIEKRAQLIKRA